MTAPPGFHSGFPGFDRIPRWSLEKTPHEELGGIRPKPGSTRLRACSGGTGRGLPVGDDRRRPGRRSPARLEAEPLWPPLHAALRSLRCGLTNCERIRTESTRGWGEETVQKRATSRQSASTTLGPVTRGRSHRGDRRSGRALTPVAFPQIDALQRMRAPPQRVFSSKRGLRCDA